MSMEIPYTVEVRPDTGLNNGKLGIWLFLASEVMLFGALFASYVMLRIGNANWPPGATYLNVPLATLNTVILISSSVTMVLAWASLAKHDFARFRVFMGITILCGFGFLIVKYFEYSAKFHHELFPLDQHLPGDLLHDDRAPRPARDRRHGGQQLPLGPGSALWKKDPVHFTNRVENAGLFWHLVDLVWIFLFPILYLL